MLFNIKVAKTIKPIQFQRDQYFPLMKFQRAIFSKHEIDRSMLTIGEVLGHGAFGVVMKAVLWERRGEKRVAVKCVKGRKLPKVMLSFPFSEICLYYLPIKNDVLLKWG